MKTRLHARILPGAHPIGLPRSTGLRGGRTGRESGELHRSRHGTGRTRRGHTVERRRSRAQLHGRMAIRGH